MPDEVLLVDVHFALLAGGVPLATAEEGAAATQEGAAAAEEGITNPAEQSEFPNVDNAETADQIRVAINLGEQEQQIASIEAEEAVVQEGTANFNANDGCDRALRSAKEAGLFV